MEEKELVTSRIANLAIGILGIVLGIMCFPIGINILNMGSSSDSIAILIMIVFFLVGAGLIVLGVLDCLWYRKKARQMVIFSFAIVALWTLLSAFTSISVATFLERIYGFAGIETGGLLLAGSIIDTFLYGLSAVFFLLAIIMLINGRSFKVLGTIGVVLLLPGVTIHLGASLYPFIHSSTHSLISFSILEMVRDLLLIPVGIILATVSGNSQYQYPYEEWDEEAAEEERKAKVLQAYKELLDNGAMSQEEYDEKKEELFKTSNPGQNE